MQKVRDAFSGVDAIHGEARTMMQELAEEFQQKWDFALEEAVEQGQNGAEVQEEAQENVQFALKNVQRDEETLQKNMAAVRKMPFVLTVNGDEFEMGDGLSEKVSDYFKRIGGKAYSPLFGWISLTKRGVKDSLGHGIGPVKALMYSAVPNVIENGAMIDYQENWKGRGYDTAVIAAPIAVANGKYKGEYYLGAIVNLYPDKSQRYYVHEAVMVEKKSDPVVQTGTLESALHGNKDRSLTNILNELNNVNEKKAETQNSPQSQSLSVASQIEFTDGERQNSLRSMTEDYGTYRSMLLELSGRGRCPVTLENGANAVHVDLTFLLLCDLLLPAVWTPQPVRLGVFFAFDARHRIAS